MCIDRVSFIFFWGSHLHIFFLSLHGNVFVFFRLCWLLLLRLSLGVGEEVLPIQIFINVASFNLTTIVDATLNFLHALLRCLLVPELDEDGA